MDYLCKGEENRRGTGLGTENNNDSTAGADGCPGPALLHPRSKLVLLLLLLITMKELELMN